MRNLLVPHPAGMQEVLALPLTRLRSTGHLLYLMGSPTDPGNCLAITFDDAPF